MAGTSGYLSFLAVGIVKMASLQRFHHLMDRKAQIPRRIANMTRRQLGLLGQIGVTAQHDSSLPIFLFTTSA